MKTILFGATALAALLSTPAYAQTTPTDPNAPVPAPASAQTSVGSTNQRDIIVTAPIQTSERDVLRDEPDLVVGDNEPYRMDLIDYTIPRHAYPERRLYAEIEVRQDLLGDAAGCEAWANRLARLLPIAASACGVEPN